MIASPAASTSTAKLLTVLAWLWLFTPLLWMWPNTRSLIEVSLSALLLMGILLSRITARIAVVILWFTGLCFLGYFFAVHSLPDEFFWQSILGSNVTEAVEYAQSYRGIDILKILAWAVPGLLASWHLWQLPRPLTHKNLRVLAWVTLGIWLVWGAVSVSKGYDIYQAFNRVGRVYPLMMVQSWERYEQNSKLAALTSDVTPPPHPPMADVLVVVLGESASAHRWSLLGYTGNDTNAALTPWKQGIVSLPLTTNGNNTGKTLPVIIAGKSLNPVPTSSLSSYLDYAKAAGFHNQVFANQQAPGFANVALRMRSDSFMQLQDGQFDDALTPYLESAIRRAQQAMQPLVVTLHTYGSHPRVEKRTPAGSVQWADPYDNSLHYTSQLLAQWIAQLDALQGKRTALIYVSDHGQDFPICGGSYIHGVTRSTYEVPFLLWANKHMRQAYASWWHQWENISQHAVTEDGVPRYTTLLPAQAIQQIAGYETTLPEVSPTTPGSYPPTADDSLCINWFQQVERLHPAAVQ